MDHIVSQDEVFAALANPTMHAGQTVRRIDTHAAVVFLAGNCAYKVKRAVRFPFLDYSTLERRKLACEAELDVNRPFAPEIYRRVTPITRETNGALKLGGTGQPVEWAVEMERFNEDNTLDNLAERGLIDVRLANALGVAVAAAHRSAPVIDATPWISALQIFIEQNDIAFRSAPTLFSTDRIDEITALSRSALHRLRPLLLARGEMGFIRRGHGDLHLGNVVMIKGFPILFDAIEFDPVVAAGDVLYDLAFLLMDLAERGLRGAANIVFNRYLSEAGRSENFDALAALPLFLSIRAAIRAKVTAALLGIAPSADTHRIGATAQSYFRYALDVLKPPHPALIAIGGLSGTGKSILARDIASTLAPAPGAVVLRSDVERKYLLGTREIDRLAETAYSPDVTANVYTSLSEKARRVASAGHSAIIDAVYAVTSERAAIANVATSLNVEFHGLFLTTDLPTRLSRVAARVEDASDADAAVARQQERCDLSDLNWTRVDASGSPAQTLARAIHGLSEPTEVRN